MDRSVGNDTLLDQKLTGLGSCRKLDQLRLLRCYQAQYTRWKFERDSEIVREKAEDELCKLMDYQNQLLNETDKLKSEHHQLLTLKVEAEVDEQASSLNELGNLLDVLEKLRQLRDGLSVSHNYLKGISDYSAHHFAELTEELMTTKDILEQNKNIISKYETTKLAEKFEQLTNMIKEEAEMKFTVNSLTNEVESLAIELKYKEICKRFSSPEAE